MIKVARDDDYTDKAKGYMKVAEKKIKTFEDAEKAIEKLKTCPLPCCSLIDKALEILRELKAGVRERIEELEKITYKDKHILFQRATAATEELRRLLEGT